MRKPATYVVRYDNLYSNRARTWLKPRRLRRKLAKKRAFAITTRVVENSG